ncbi:Selenide, water dikinase [bioreactor metagenome]|uniref:Selenide, water dikinase n=1 Tax=bioreactor metagenome TaxID=1076179 RepID=A0A645BW45_9ZZZZ
MSDELKLTKLAQCAGCGAKVGAGVLAQLLSGLPVRHDPNLLVGYDTSDDASVYKISDDLVLIQTVDFFPPIVDDPFTFGQIAAANALSDVYAMGGEPRLALNLLCASPQMSPEAVHAVLRGGYDKVYEAGAVITGGHSIQDSEPKYGLSVTGFGHPEKIWMNSRAQAGDVLLLTKPLGIGILTTAHKGGMADENAYAQAIEQMRTLNKTARDIMTNFTIHSCTDVTGFGLLGHALEMAKGGGITLILEHERIPLLPQAYELAELGLLPEGMYRNRNFAGSHVFAAPGVSRAAQDVFYDPQTSGGLLMAVPEAGAQLLIERLTDALPYAAQIGYVSHPGEYSIEIR